MDAEELKAAILSAFKAALLGGEQVAVDQIDAVVTEDCESIMLYAYAGDATYVASVPLGPVVWRRV